MKICLPIPDAETLRQELLDMHRKKEITLASFPYLRRRVYQGTAEIDPVTTTKEDQTRVDLKLVELKLNNHALFKEEVLPPEIGKIKDLRGF